MSLTEVTVEGTLRPDGTVALDERPALPPGRVTVVLRPAKAAPAAQEDWFQYMLNARKQMEDAGSHFMDDAELKAHIEWLREGDRIDDLLRESDEHGRRPGPPEC
jgi:hypothetical protein